MSLEQAVLTLRITLHSASSALYWPAPMLTEQKARARLEAVLQLLTVGEDDLPIRLYKALIEYREWLKEFLKPGLKPE